MKSLKLNSNFFRSFFSSFLILMLFTGFTPAPIEITIDVAPNVLNIASSGTVVTVHTDIAYSAVEGATVTLNDVEIDWWKSDNRGQFVAKFDMEDVETLITANVLELGTILLELEGTTKLGVGFSGSQEIKVINVTLKGSAKN